MFDLEYKLLHDHLGASREIPTKFFALANTVSARNLKGDNDQHGWMGIRFQTHADSPPSDVLLPLNIMDPSAVLQQDALCRLGVNLIYAAYRQRNSMDEFLNGLFDSIAPRRLELDVLYLCGPAFPQSSPPADPKYWALRALELGMGHVMLFDPSGTLVKPSSLFVNAHSSSNKAGANPSNRCTPPWSKPESPRSSPTTQTSRRTPTDR